MPDSALALGTDRGRPWFNKPGQPSVHAAQACSTAARRQLRRAVAPNANASHNGAWCSQDHEATAAATGQHRRLPALASWT